MKPIKLLIIGTIVFLCTSLYIKSKTIQMDKKYEPYRNYEYIYSEKEFKAIEDSVKKENQIWK